MKSHGDILEYLDKENKSEPSVLNDQAKELARQYLEECDGDYDAARILAQAMVMLAKLSYELLTKIQTAIEREELAL